MTNMRNILALIGRIALAAIFIKSGFGKIEGFDRTVAAIAAAGLPLPPAGAVVAIVVELIGGLALAVGFKTRWTALILAVFTLVAALFFHNYWAVSADKVANQTIHFWKNISIVGGMLVVAAFGPGRISVDKN